MLRWLAALWLVAWICAVPARAEPLHFGLLPSRSTAALMRDYAVLRQYLEQHLGQEVLLGTAPDFQAFVQRTHSGEYDFLYTAPHFARLAQLEHGLVPVVRIVEDVSGVLLVREDGDITRIQALKGKTVATPDPLAIVTMLGEGLLIKAGLTPGRDVTLKASASHTSAALSVVHGDADAAVVFPPTYRTLPEHQRRALRVLAQTEGVPGTVVMAHPRLGAARTARLRTALLEFAEHDPRSKAFFHQVKYSGFRPISADEMRALTPYVDMLKPRFLTQQ